MRRCVTWYEKRNKSKLPYTDKKKRKKKPNRTNRKKYGSDSESNET